ncbi:OmpA family protein [Terriglobus aquaticus]|uniref:OmpA family protein n=1 Tax=Terriglobus aquaticus TaxID=940139 RepID=A0ABW9KLY7_9BACT|nr:OmpA family protein [Terriglobus aquaticus]
MYSNSTLLRVAAVSALFASSTLAFSQAAQQSGAATSDAQSTATTQTATAQPAKQDAADSGSYATGQPLPMQSKEGFWGHMNPLARKKWVHRQIDPVKDRVNELDQLQAKNANDIKDVDSRAQAGIRQANDAAAQADAHAQAAGQRATQANGLATQASTRTDALHGTVSNLDQYQTVSSTAVPFLKGRTTLGTKAKADLDQVASTLGTEKGYILEVQGYSRSGVASSQAMADAVVRYLVTEHQVPVYRIYKSGLGHVKTSSSTETASTEKPLVNGVRVTLLHNSLAQMDQGTPQASNSTPAASTGTPTGTDSARMN